MDASAVSTNGGTASASVDPYISIDASNPNANEYSVEVSSGVDNSPSTSTTVPEPSSLLLLAVGLAGVIAFWRKCGAQIEGQGLD